MDELQKHLRSLTRFLNDNELFYVFTGQLALRMVGCADTPDRLDLLVNLAGPERDRLLNFLEEEGFVAQSRWRGPTELRHKSSGMVLWLRLAGSAADMATIGRRVPATLGYVNFFIPSCEDIILDLVGDRQLKEEAVAKIYGRFRNYLDIGYLIIASRERGMYPRFIKMKIRADK
jgi:hypothetical protein